MIKPMLRILLVALLLVNVEAANATLRITRQPQNQIVWVGTQAAFSVTAKGAKKINYQWQKDGENLVGQTKNVLRIKKTTPADWGVYRVIVSSGGTFLESETAVLAAQKRYQPEGENFNDPDSTKGNLYYDESGSLVSEISDGKLRFAYVSGIDPEEVTAYWFWGTSPERKRSFDVRMDGVSTTQGKLQFVVTCDPGISYRIEGNGSRGNFNAGSWGEDPPRIPRIPYPTSSTSFSFRVVYDAASKVRTLKAYFDEDGPLNGESWTLLQTVRNPNFLSGRPIIIGLCYNNNESGEALDGSQVTVDNFEAR